MNDLSASTAYRSALTSAESFMLRQFHPASFEPGKASIQASLQTIAAQGPSFASLLPSRFEELARLLPSLQGILRFQAIDSLLLILAYQERLRRQGASLADSLLAIAAYQAVDHILDLATYGVVPGVQPVNPRQSSFTAVA